MKCETCDGRGCVWTDLRNWGFGEGFVAFMSAGCIRLLGEDGSTYHEIVCPRCDGSGQVLEEKS